MGFTVSAQTMIFLGSILVGAAFGVLYDFFRISRLALPLPAPVILLEDVVFFLLCGVVTFAYLLTTAHGQVRFFILVGELLGGVLYYLTIGELVMGVSQAILAVVRRILKLLWQVFVSPLLWVWHKLRRLLKKISGKATAYCKKQRNNLNFRLKQRRILLYNLIKAKPGQRSKRRTAGKGEHL